MREAERAGIADVAWEWQAGWKMLGYFRMHRRFARDPQERERGESSPRYRLSRVSSIAASNTGKARFILYESYESCLRLTVKSELER